MTASDALRSYKKLNKHPSPPSSPKEIVRPRAFNDDKSTHFVNKSFAIHEPIDRVLCLQDVHFPDNLPILSIKKFIGEYQPTILNIVGDILDPHCISHWEEPKWFHRGIDNVVDEFNELCGRFHTFMVNLTDSLPINCKIIYHIGNHEDWIFQFCQKFPQLTKITMDDVVGDIGRDIQFIPRYQFHKIGKLQFTHGEHFQNQNPAKSYVERCKTSVAFGHHHIYAVSPDYSMVDDSNKYIGIAMPCWTTKQASYGNKQPNRWQNGFMVVNVKKNSGNFSHHPILASPNGNFIDQFGREYEN